MIGSAKELLDQVNQKKEIFPYLKVVPFTEHNVQIIIFNHDKAGLELLDPMIASAEISRGVLTYRTINPDNTLRVKNRFTETYQEAVKLVRNLH